jgi:hypothetical protein
MEMLNLETIKSGLMAGAAVAAVSAITVASIGTLVHDTDGDLAGFAGKWAAISLVFGIVAALGYSLIHSSFGLGASGYLYMATGLAVALTAMEFLPIYGTSSFAPHWQVYAALNFVYALGFGLLVPKMMG